MKYLGAIAAAALLAATIAPPAFAGSAAANPEFVKRQKACKKEAKAQGLYMSKRKAYIKECMAKTT